MKHGHDEEGALVHVFFQEGRIGLYRAKHMGGNSVLLKHGAISFPVGTELGIEVSALPDRRAIDERAQATVFENSTDGMLVAVQSG